jgi:hypothetical protein
MAYFCGAIFLSLAFLGLVQWIWPSVLPFGLFDVWKSKGTFWEWMLASWPILLWATGLQALLSFTSLNFRNENKQAEGILGLHTVMSMRAGFFEEITFRWLYMLTGIISAKVLNFCFFGFLGFGILQWFQTSIMGPVANFVTLGALGVAFANPANWAIGAGVLSANASFRDGHKYQGIMGLANSWFCGMFFFVLLFKYGLLACILVHFLYDFFVGLVCYIDMVVERQMGWGRVG